MVLDVCLVDSNLNWKLSVCFIFYYRPRVGGLVELSGRFSARLPGGVE